MNPNDKISRENFPKVSTQSGATTEDILDYIKLVVREKPNTVIIYIGSNDLAKGVIQHIRENDKDKNIQIDFSSMCYRADRYLEKEINDTNGRLKNYCSGNGFTLVDSQ